MSCCHRRAVRPRNQEIEGNISYQSAGVCPLLEHERKHGREMGKWRKTTERRCSKTVERRSEARTGSAYIVPTTCTKIMIPACSIRRENARLAVSVPPGS